MRKNLKYIEDEIIFAFQIFEYQLLELLIQDDTEKPFFVMVESLKVGIIEGIFQSSSTYIIAPTIRSLYARHRSC